MPREAAETQPLLGDQAAVPREAHWTQGCLCQRESGTAPLQGCLQRGAWASGTPPALLAPRPSVPWGCWPQPPRPPCRREGWEAHVRGA